MPTMIVTNDPMPQSSTVLTTELGALEAPEVSTAVPQPDQAGGETTPVVSATTAANEPTTATTEPQPLPEPGDDPQYGRRAQKRITDLLRRATRAEMALEQERALNTALQQRFGQPPLRQATLSPPPALVPSAVPAGRPQPQDYTTHEEWIEALTSWKANQQITAQFAAREAQEHTRRQAAVQAVQQATWQRQLATARTTYPDFDDMLDQAHVLASPALQQELVTSPHGAVVLYYLAQHPEEVQVLNSMAPRQLLRRLGVLEAQVTASAPSATTPAAPATPSGHEARLPAPFRVLTPVNSSTAAAPITGFREGMSLTDYNRMRDAQQRRAG